jgi:hypothetical protein
VPCLSTQTLSLSASEGQINGEDLGCFVQDILVATVVCVGGFGDSKKNCRAGRMAKV